MARSAIKNVVRLDGITEVLRGLPRDLQTQILATAVAEAARPIVQAAKRNAESSRRTGALQASISARVRKYKRDAVATAVVGPDRSYYAGVAKLRKGDDKRGAEQPSRYAHLVEFGHNVAKGGKLRDEYVSEVALVRNSRGKLVRRRRRTERIRRFATGVVGGFVPAKPFLRPALLETSALAGANMLNGIRKGIERARAKLVRKGVHVR